MNAGSALSGVRRNALSLALGLLILGTCPLQAYAAVPDNGALVSLARPVQLSRGDAVVGALPMNHPVQILVGLKLRDRAGLDALIADNAKKQAKGQRPTLLTPEQSRDRHGATVEQAQAVADWLTRRGFSNVRIGPNRLYVMADGTAASARDAFATSFAQVRTHDGRLAFANTDAVRIPAALQDTVQAVLGLQTVHQLHTHAKVLRKVASLAPGEHPRDRLHPLRALNVGTHTVTDEAIRAYNFTALYGSSPLGMRNTTVGIVSVGDLTETINDLQSTMGFYRQIPVTVEYTNGTATGTTGNEEWHLDSQAIAGMTGQYFSNKNLLGRMKFYSMQSLSNVELTNAFGVIQADNDVRLINVSLGECETFTDSGQGGDGSAQLDDAIFALAVAQGITFSVSTGDSGADECPSDGQSLPIPSYPASSPYVVAVAGTRVTVDDPGGGGTPTYVSEKEWTNSGGSESTFEPKPSWQTLWSGTNRGVADVAFDADPNTGALIYMTSPSPGFYQVGGTSLAAPLFAGVWGTLLTQNGNGYGFAGPIIYALPAGDFRDITTGDNGDGSIATGYDPESGRGSMPFTTQLVTDSQGLGNTRPTANFTFTRIGLTASFTDASSDSDGSVVAYAWDFGDGATSTAQNPSHTYAAAGTYKVKELVTDNGHSASLQTIKQVTVAPKQLLIDPDFERGLPPTPWAASPGVRFNNIPANAHGGSWYVQMGGNFGGTDKLSQQVAIASGYHSAKLDFYLNIATEEAPTATPQDFLYVDVYDAAGTTRLARLASFSNRLGGGFVNPPVYSHYTYDLSAFIGQTVRLRFTADQPNVSDQTNYTLDDVTLTAQ